jgi:hypothetical protein
MHLNTDQQLPPSKPCIRDMHELLRDHLDPNLIKLVPLEELDRRGHEIVAEHPRFREEMPLVVRGEAGRRKRLQGLRKVESHHRHQVA